MRKDLVRLGRANMEGLPMWWKGKGVLCRWAIGVVAVVVEGKM